MQREIKITIDGRETTAVHHEYAISAIRRLGIYVPTLCDHDDLEPAGACRLCLVEVQKRGQTKFVTSCNFPVEEGVELVTRSEALEQHRRTVMELLLAKCPDVPSLQQIARKVGLETARFTSEDHTCILCGLCTRMCSSFATSAITTYGRGTKKEVGGYGGSTPHDCIGCGGCEKICPTGHITSASEAGNYTIWDADFPLATCVVDKDKCTACGACEEACPFSVPRVVLRKNDPSAAEISVHSCRGCGVCLAACPSAAISSPRQDRTLPSPHRESTGRPTVLAIGCGRNDFKHTAKLLAAENIGILELPCSGTVSSAMLLGALGLGYDGVVVLGRHESSCRLEGSEDQARRLVEWADKTAQFVGLGAGRIAFVEPAATSAGPVAALREYAGSLNLSPLEGSLPQKAYNDSIDGALQIAAWLAGRTELTIDATPWLESKGLPVGTLGQTAIWAGNIPLADLVLGDLLAPFDLGEQLKGGLELLRSMKIDATILVGDPGHPPIPQNGETLYTLDGTPQGGLVPIAKLIETHEAGDSQQTVADVATLIDTMLRRRRGSWRTTHREPVLATDAAAAQLRT